MLALLTSPLGKFAAWAAAAIALGAALLYGVHRIDQRGYDRAATECTANVEKIKLDQRAEADRAEKAQQAERDEQGRKLSQLSQRLLDANGKVAALARQLKERTHDVSTQYRPVPGAALKALPEWIVPDGWLCDYNRAIGYAAGDPMFGAAAAASRAAAATCAADAFAPSGVTAEQILGHHEEYGEYTQRLEHQVNALLDAYEQLEQQAAQRGAE